MFSCSPFVLCVHSWLLLNLLFILFGAAYPFLDLVPLKTTQPTNQPIWLKKRFRFTWVRIMFPYFISVLNLYNELVKKGYNILFCWIPGHAGIKGNDQADTAAKQASNPLNCTIPYSDLKNTIRNLIKDKWQINWNLQANNKLKQIKPTITPCPSIPCHKNWCPAYPSPNRSF